MQASWKVTSSPSAMKWCRCTFMRVGVGALHREAILLKCLEAVPQRVNDASYGACTPLGLLVVHRVMLFQAAPLEEHAEPLSEARGHALHLRLRGCALRHKGQVPVLFSA